MATAVSTVPLNDISNGAVGAAPVGEKSVTTIVRDPGGVTVAVHTDLEPGTYTVWLVVFNDPSRCTHVGPSKCLPPPAGGTDIPDSVMFGSGQVVPFAGRHDFAAYRAVGDTSGISGGRERAGLTNAMGAEIHTVVRSHGPTLPDALQSQISTFGGGCDVNQCVDVQGGVHLAGAATAESLKLDRILGLVSRIASRLGLRP